jgi:hypothetical protein
LHKEIEAQYQHGDQYQESYENIFYDAHDGVIRRGGLENIVAD